MEPGKLEVHLELKELCTDTATEIYPHHDKMYPCGLKESTALDQELSEEPQAVKPPLSSSRCRSHSRFRVMPSQHRAVSDFLCDCAGRCAGVFVEQAQNCNPLLCRSARQQNRVDRSLHFLRCEALQ